MARYIGPKTKIARRFGDAIYGEDKYLDRRNFPPGQHGQASKRSKKSEYAIQLREKQKAKYTYGILERQFRNMFEKAAKSRGITGEVLLQLCERRLDNVVYRMGFSNTRSGARQLVSHKHILVNDKNINIPSYLLNPGDEIKIKESSKDIVIGRNSFSTKQVCDWIIFNIDTMSGRFVLVPERMQIPEKINEQLIVELYSK